MDLIVIFIVFLVILGSVIGYFLHRQGAVVPLKQVEKEYIRLSLYNDLRADCNEKASMIIDLQAEKASLSTLVEKEKENLQQEKERIDAWEKQIVDKFESLASRIAKNNSDSFKKDAGEHMDQVIKPLEKTIARIEQQLKETNESRIKDSTELRGELQKIGQLNHELQLEAQQLTKALTTNPKHQGSWGENVLETLLDKAGLVKNLHFEREVLGKNDEHRLRADVIIHLPSDRHLVIDSKVSLNEYCAYMNSDGKKASTHLKNHIKAVKDHINTLHNKQYNRIYSINSPDMVFMFLPIEGSLIASIQEDPELFYHAINKNIMLVTSSTLFVSLRLVSELWQQDKQFENAELIAIEAGKLRDQIIRFLQNMDKIEDGLTRAQIAYGEARKRLITGNNNVVRVTQKIEKLGAKVNDHSDNTLDKFKKLAS